MKGLNKNKAMLYLLFTRDPQVKMTNEELEYYSSDDDKLMGFISRDREDGTFHALLFDRDSCHRFRVVGMNLDNESIEMARIELGRLMDNYVRDDNSLKTAEVPNDFFKPIVSPKQMNPIFNMMIDPNGFFTAAKEVIEEISFHFTDKDGNFVEQFQSKNGLDARIWELYLWCYFREENFSFNYKYEAPDFLIMKGDYEVAIEAVHINRKEDPYIATKIPTEAEILKKLENETPLMYGSPLFSKLKHQYEKHSYWELEHVKGKPLVYAIADFHADMSMTWSFPAIAKILYGIDQKSEITENGTILHNESGIKFQKGETAITPLFLDKQFKYISAVMFSPCGTLAKFNRMGTQAGMGQRNSILYQIKMCYNTATNAVLPDIIGDIVDEHSNETWADGIQIFHNPFAEIPLEPLLFPRAGHHFYDNGLLRSSIPENHIISTITYNIKNLPFMPKSFHLHADIAFDEVKRKWRM